ncbi:MAG: hypothetical protein JRI89_17455, partial [Deltaproteobacteria bacterium]|nr:hypothetical protein [Deltaproteobacteria bacterium]
PSSLSKKAVQQHCSDNLEHFMVPKYVEIVAELPRTSSGKVDKRLLQIDSQAGGNAGQHNARES